MCEYCNGGQDLLETTVETLGVIHFYGKNSNDDTLTIGEIKQALDIEDIRVYYDRGYLRLTKGDDTGCLDHSEDMIKANFCTICGSPLNE